MSLKYCRYCLVCVFLSQAGFAYAADWQENLESQFDIVETFDQLQDWGGGSYSRGRNLSQDNMPKKLDGSLTIWNMFDYWSTESSTNNWIADHGSQNVWRESGKSLIMDMNQNTSANKGPARFGTYFGGNTSSSIDPYSTNGVVNSGYKEDAYVFQMVKFKPNGFPKSTDGVTNKYYSYYKWWVLSTGNTAANVCVEGRSDCTYGASNAHTMLYIGDGTNSLQQYKLEYYNDAEWPDFPSNFQMWKPYHTIGTLDTYIDSEQWFGLEVHVHMGTPGQTDGYQEQWIYDNNGTVHYLGKSQDMIMMTAGYDWGFNYFFQGGNISFQSDVESQGLDVSYYVDDIIIDSERIGPTYFQLLDGNFTKKFDITDVQATPGKWVQ